MDNPDSPDVYKCIGSIEARLAGLEKRLDAMFPMLIKFVLSPLVMILAGGYTAERFLS